VFNKGEFGEKLNNPGVFKELWLLKCHIAGELIICKSLKLPFFYLLKI
jgi:hypothetical protein